MKTPASQALLLAVLCAFMQPALAEEANAPTQAVQRASDGCTFYRMRARGLGIDHWLTEVVWACEAIARRRNAGMAMNDRMLAVEFALDRYRRALVEDRRGRLASVGLRAQSEQRAAEQRLADDTGILAALEAIRTGF